MTHVGVDIPLAFVLGVVSEHLSVLLDLLNAWLILLVFIETVFEWWQLLSNLLNFKSLFFEFYWINVALRVSLVDSCTN